MKQQLISIVNGVEISAVSDESGSIFVPVKPICDAIGVAYPPQFTKLQEHEILSSTIMLSVMVAADGKQREMVCLPLEYVYGWIFTINANNVAESARTKVLQYQRECYEVLYRHFAGSLRRRVEENEAEIELLQQINSAMSREKESKVERRKAEEALGKLRAERLNPQPTPL